LHGTARILGTAIPGVMLGCMNTPFLDFEVGDFVIRRIAVFVVDKLPRFEPSI